MSYQRRRQRVRRALSGIQSQPPGASVFRHALEGGMGDITEYGTILTGHAGSVRAPRWYRAMQGASLTGDDAPDPSLLTSPMFSDPFQADVSSRLSDLQRLEAERNRQDQIRGIFQIVATLSIPLAAAAWKWIFKRRSASSAS